MDAVEITRIRREKGLSQVALGRILGVSQPTISGIERGVIAPSAPVLARLRQWLEREATPAPRSPGEVAFLVPQNAPATLPFLRFESWGRPEYSGDFAALFSVGKNAALFVVVDVAGHGTDVLPARTFVQGWLQAYVGRLRGVPRISELAGDLSATLRDGRIDVSAFFAVVATVPGTPHTVNYEAGSFGLAAPLLLSGPPFRTRPSAEVCPALPLEPEEVRVTVIDGLEAPWRLVAATDGLLQRIGAGSESDGVKQLRSRFSLGPSPPPLEELLSTEIPWIDDEVCATLEWAAWDFEGSAVTADEAETRRMLGFVRLRSRPALGEAKAEEFCGAVLEAFQNAGRHAYPKGPGRVSLRFREEASRFRAEISDNGAGMSDRRKVQTSEGGFAVMRTFCKEVFADENRGGGTVVTLLIDKPTQNDQKLPEGGPHG
ncbi:MAG: ATP-binding protein [Acidobacteriota bacterium]